MFFALGDGWSICLLCLTMVSSEQLDQHGIIRLDHYPFWRYDDDHAVG